MTSFLVFPFGLIQHQLAARKKLPNSLHYEKEFILQGAYMDGVRSCPLQLFQPNPEFERLAGGLLELRRRHGQHRQRQLGQRAYRVR